MEAYGNCVTCKYLFEMENLTDRKCPDCWEPPHAHKFIRDAVTASYLCTCGAYVTDEQIETWPYHVRKAWFNERRRTVDFAYTIPDGPTPLI